MIIANHLEIFTFRENINIESSDSFSQKLLKGDLDINDTIKGTNAGEMNYFIQLEFIDKVEWLMTTPNGDEIFNTLEAWFILQDNGLPSFYIKDENENFLRYDCEPYFEYDWNLWVKTLFDYDFNLYRSTSEVP